MDLLLNRTHVTARMGVMLCKFMHVNLRVAVCCNVCYISAHIFHECRLHMCARRQFLNLKTLHLEGKFSCLFSFLLSCISVLKVFATSIKEVPDDVVSFFPPVRACVHHFQQFHDLTTHLSLCGCVCMQANTQSAPVSLHYVVDSHDPHNRFPNAKELLYGTDVGMSI